jgi:hypothetical protein
VVQQAERRRQPTTEKPGDGTGSTLSPDTTTGLIYGTSLTEADVERLMKQFEK